MFFGRRGGIDHFIGRVDDPLRQVGRVDYRPLRPRSVCGQHKTQDQNSMFAFIAFLLTIESVFIFIQICLLDQGRYIESFLAFERSETTENQYVGSMINRTTSGSFSSGTAISKMPSQRVIAKFIDDDLI